MKLWARGIAAFGVAVAMVIGSTVAAPSAQADIVAFAPVFNTFNASGQRDDSGVAALTDTAWLGPKLTKWKGSTTVPTSTGFLISGLEAGNTVTQEWAVTDPPASIYAAALGGTITSTITADANNLADSKLAMYQNASWMADSNLYPTNTFPRMKGNVWFNAQNSGGYTYHFDFTGLADGYLPVGSAILSSDVDVCGTTQSEGVTYTSDASGAWLSWPITKDDGTRGHLPQATPVGSFDTDTSAFSLRPATCSTNASDQTFLVTTTPITSLTVHQTEPLPAATGAGSWFGFYVNTTAASPAVSVLKTLNGSQVTGAPGPELTPGSQVSWGFEVVNTGNVALTNATVTDDKVPASNIDCGDGTNVIPLLLPNSIPVTCRAYDTAVSGQYTNTATVSATPATNAGVAFTDAAAPPSVTDADSSWYSGVLHAKLTLDASVDVARIEAGQTATWTTTLTNDGGGDATDTVATFTYPDGVTPDLSSLPGGATLNGRVVTIPISGTFKAGASSTFTLKGSVISGTTGSLTAVWSAAATNDDTSATQVTSVPASACASATDKACATTTVVALSLSAAVSAPSSVIAGSTFDYTVTIGNTGGTDSKGTSATFTLPEGVTLVNPPPGATVSGRTITWPLGTLPAGTDKSFTIKVLAELDSSGITTAPVAATGESPAGTAAQASASANVEIAAAPAPTPTSGTVIRTFQVDRYKVNTKTMGKKVAHLAADGKLTYREDRFAWGHSEWQFVQVEVAEDASTAQLIVAINAKTSKRVGDVAKTSKVKVIKTGSLIIAWELGAGAMPTAKRGLAWGTRHKTYQKLIAWR